MASVAVLELAQQHIAVPGVPTAERTHLGIEETERRIAAYAATNTDKEAAKLLRIPRVTYASWRKRHGLPPKWKGHLGEHEHARRLQAYETYPDDVSAAAALGLARGLFRQWRRLQGLPSRNPKWRRSTVPP